MLAALFLHGWLGYKALVVGVLLGAAGQVALQWRGLRGIALRPRFEWRDPKVRQIERLYLPVALGLIVTQAQVFLDLALQNSTGPHSVSWLNWATRVYQLPLGFVATAMSLASLPSLSVLTGRAFLDTLTRGLKVVAMLIVPAVVILAVLGTPIITLAFRHGANNAGDVTSIVAGLDWYLPGLGFAAIDQLLIFAFYANKDTTTPVLVGLLSIAGYGIAALIALNAIHLGYRGLALADSVKQVVHAVVLFALLWRRQGSLAGFGLGRTALKIAASSVACAAVCLLALHLGSGIHRTVPLLAFVVVSSGAALAAYFAALSLLRAEELTIVLCKLRGRLAARAR